jgi:hypothetical protein
LPYHIEVARVDVGESEGSIVEFGNGEQISYQPTDEAEAQAPIMAILRDIRKTLPVSELFTGRVRKEGKRVLL